MHPKRRTLATNSRRSKQLRPSELPEVVPAQLATTTSVAPVADNDAGLMHLNIEALATTISVAATEVVNAALATHPSGHNVRVPSVSTPIVHPNDRAVEDEVTVLTGVSAEGTLESSRTFSAYEAQPHTLFTSIAISLGTWVSAKIKAKIWQNKYVDFGALLASGPPNKRLSLSLTQGTSIPSQPLRALEPVQSYKKVQSISQWVTAFDTFVTIYVERAPQDAPKLMKYCEVVRDITFKSGEWLFYDEQFRFLPRLSLVRDKVGG